MEKKLKVLTTTSVRELVKAFNDLLTIEGSKINKEDVLTVLSDKGQFFLLYFS